MIFVPMCGATSGRTRTRAEGKQKISISITNKEWVKINPETNQIFAGIKSKLNVFEIVEIHLVEEKAKKRTTKWGLKIFSFSI